MATIPPGATRGIRSDGIALRGKRAIQDRLDPNSILANAAGVGKWLAPVLRPVVGTAAGLPVVPFPKQFREDRS
jgi:hypothetical protein